MKGSSRLNEINAKTLGATAGAVLVVLGAVFTNHEISRWAGLAFFAVVQGTIAWNWRRDLIELEEYRDRYLSD